MGGPSSDGSTIEPRNSDAEAAAAASAEPAVWRAPEAESERIDTFETSDEVARLEALLAARATELSAQRLELARARELLRDATQSFERAAPRPADTADLAELRRQHDAAVARAIEAEAGRAEYTFRLDELLGHIAQMTGAGTLAAPDSGTAAALRGGASSSDTAPALRGGATSSDTAPALRGGATSSDTAPALRGGATSSDTAPALRGGATSSDTAPALRGGATSSDTAPALRGGASILGGEPLDVTCARLNGTVRGLMSALAETEESRDTTGARLLLAEQDLAMLAGRARLLERELAEAREQNELESLHTRSLAQRLEGSLPGRDAAQLGGELAGLRARCEEAERVIAALSNAGAERAPERNVELERMLARETEKGREAAAELARVVAERMVLGEELTRAQADVAGLRNALAALTHELDAERSSSRRGVSEHRTQAERLRDALRESRQVLGELSGALDRASQPPPRNPRESYEDTSSDPTQPGMPTYIEAMEGLEELVALRDDHIRSLTTTLQLERDRVRSVEQVISALEPSAHMLPVALWTELLDLVKRR